MSGGPSKYPTSNFNIVIPGDVGFGLTHGPGRYTIPFGQALVGDGSVWEHVAMGVGSNSMVEAMPPKARIRTVPKDMLWFRLPLSDAQRDYCATQPWLDLQQGDVKYGWLAFLNIALVKWGIRPEWLKNEVENGRRRICSQLVDKYLTDAGVDVLEGVLPGEVTPGDLSFRFGYDIRAIPFRLDGQTTFTRPTR